jgi:hypothetical protein
MGDITSFRRGPASTSKDELSLQWLLTALRLPIACVLQALLQDPARAGTLDPSFYQPVEQQPTTYEMGPSSFGGPPSMAFPHSSQSL